MNISSEGKYFGFIKRQHFRYYLAAFVSLITFIVYLKSLQNEFVNWDDFLYVVENPYIRSLNPAFFRWAFFDFYASYWSPITWISHAIDYAVWGLNPSGYHLTNVIIHSMNTFIVVLLIMRLLKTREESAINNGMPSFMNERSLFMIGGATGILFGVHPVHVESVAWVAERKDLLCALFFLLSITAYTKYAGSINSGMYQKNPAARFMNKHYLLAIGMFILALLSKPMAVTLPMVLLILDWHPFGRIQSPKTFLPVFLEKMPFLALSLASSILTILAAKAGGALSMVESIPMSTRALVAAKSVIVYLWKMISPLNLIPFYAYPKNASLLSSEYLLPVVLVVVITISCSVLAWKQRLWLSAWLYYIVTLIPVLGIVQAGSQPMADRFTYLPSLGPFLVTGIIVGLVSTRVNTLSKGKVLVKFFTMTVAFSAFIAMSYLTFEQIGVWKNSLDLWNFVIDKARERDDIPYVNRGVTFYRMGQIDKAIADYDMAIALNPSRSEAYNNRGFVFDKMGQIDKAIADYDMAIALNPRYSDAYNNRGAAFGKMGQIDKAIEDFDMAIALNPRYSDAYNNRGVALAIRGKINDAGEDFDKAIDLNPNDASTYLNRGKAHLKSGNSRLAISDFQKACSLGSKKGCDMLQNFREE